MNKRILAVVVVLVVLLGGAGVALAATRLAGPATDAGSTPPAVIETPEAAAPSASAEPTTASSAGAYVDYDGGAIAAAEGRVLLFFHAPWCPQCRSVESDILAQGVPDGVTIIKVDYDSHQDLRQQYGVTLQTTFVEVNAAGDGLQSYIAYDDPHLDAVIAAML